MLPKHFKWVMVKGCRMANKTDKEKLHIHAFRQGGSKKFLCFTSLTGISREKSMYINFCLAIIPTVCILLIFFSFINPLYLQKSKFAAMSHNLNNIRRLEMFASLFFLFFENCIILTNLASVYSEIII